MKKLLFVVLILVSLVLISIYYFIPAKIQIAEKVNISASDTKILKYLSKAEGWEKWWPKNSNTVNSKNQFCNDQFCFQLVKATNSEDSILITSQELLSESKLTHFEGTKNSIELRWIAEIETGFNPIEKVKRYQAGLRLKSDIKDLLQHLKGFFNSNKNVYGINIQTERVKNFVLLETEKTSSTYPDLKFISSLVNQLEKEISRSDAQKADSAMLSIFKPYKGDYVITVAIPINKEIQTNKPIHITKMVQGSLLSTEVKGGPKTIENAFSSFREYVRDKKHVSPAMPYEMMISDRNAVKDTAQWVTKIYYPVM